MTGLALMYCIRRTREGGGGGGTLVYMASPGQVLWQSGFGVTICQYIDMIQTAVMCHRTSQKQTNIRSKETNHSTNIQFTSLRITVLNTKVVLGLFTYAIPGLNCSITLILRSLKTKHIIRYLSAALNHKSHLAFSV